jgi:hypothetical protein
MRCVTTVDDCAKASSGKQTHIKKTGNVEDTGRFCMVEQEDTTIFTAFLARPLNQLTSS